MLSRLRQGRWEVVVGCTAVLAMATAADTLARLHVDAPALRGAIEIAITMWALAAATLLFRTFRHTRRRRDLLLIAALAAAAITDFLFEAVPALADAPVLSGGEGARLASGMLVALAFAAAAVLGERPVRRSGRRAVGITVFAASVVLSVSWLIDVLTGGARVGAAAAGSTDHHPISLVASLVSAELLLLAGLGFLFRARRGQPEGWLLAAAACLLSATRLQYLPLPGVAVDWVTPREGMRLAAYGLLLAAAIRQYVRWRHEAAQRALAAERERLARDLHDGLAQDLAFIAAHSQRLDSGLGDRHPVTLAARRALAASRGAIVDLSSSTSPTTASALRAVADEMEGRFGVRVAVRVGSGDSPGVGDIAPADREEIVRIAREAILNAIRHGGAGQIGVTFDASGSTPLLRIVDDGTGIDEPTPERTNGFGLPTMRARADSLGAELVARKRPLGGTEVELVVR